MSYSNSSGGTLTLSSPSSVHNVDVSVSAAVRTIRRSLSRSPSKFQLLRSSSACSDKSASSSPHSPSPSNLNQMEEITYPAFPPPQHANTTTPQQSPQRHQFASQTWSTPYFRPKLGLRSSRPKAQSAKPLTRTRLSPRSPPKRALGANNSIGNVTAPATSPPVPIGQENNFNSFATAFGAAARSTLVKSGSRHSMHLDLSGSSKAAAAASRFLDVKSETFPSATTSSPLKRADPIMTTDALGSPVAKRRSLHGNLNLTSVDLGILDQTPHAPRSGFEIHEDANQEYKLTGSFSAAAQREQPMPTSAVHLSSVPKRTTSLRRSTLQQRHDPRSSSWGKRQGERYLAQQASDASAVQRTKHQRMSLDGVLGPQRAPLPSASAHFLERPVQPPHPLSQTLTTASMATSSSSSSVADPDESPTHAPAPVAERPRASHLFSQSVPIGSAPPNGPNATPAYKSAKPLQSIFASTGMKSKTTQDFDLQPAFGRSSRMPDTPCKKPFTFGSSANYNSNTFPPSGSSRKERSIFGGENQSPFSPAAPAGLGASSNSSRSGLLLFAPRNSRGRRSGFRGFDPDMDAQMPDDGDLPPTPTKQVSVTGKSVSAGAIHSTTPAVPRAITPTASIFAPQAARSTADFSSSPLENMGRTLADPPTTPRDPMMAPDARRLSYFNAQPNSVSRRAPTFPPATPTTNGGRTSLLGGPDQRSITPVNATTPNNVHGPKDMDASLAKRFTKSELLGQGEFSDVFCVVGPAKPEAFCVPAGGSGTPPTPARERVYAVKKLRTHYMGNRDRENKLREVSVLAALQDRDNILQYVDSWEFDNCLYIQTEYCEQGNLEEALGRDRLDDFRIWKILLEMSQGLSHIHDAGFIHLDLKPANIFVNFSGTLKIGDFGLASRWPAPKHIDGEGDRRYMGPEILRGQFDQPADIFALGMIVVEMALNVVLPDNGDSWKAFREGVIVQPLTSREAQTVQRDEVTGLPLGSSVHSFSRDGPHFGFNMSHQTHDPSNLFGSEKRQTEPLDFMMNEDHPGSLDTLVRWMISPEPSHRPTAHDILRFSTVSWTSRVRQDPAMSYEGAWGPCEKPGPLEELTEERLLATDVEMTDV